MVSPLSGKKLRKICLNFSKDILKLQYPQFPEATNTKLVPMMQGYAKAIQQTLSALDLATNGIQSFDCRSKP